MPRREICHLSPTGWKSPHEERRRLCPMDYGTYTWINWVITFKVDNESDKPSFVGKLKRGIEATLGQSRHCVGTIEKNEYGDYSIITRPESTACFVILWLDGPNEKCLSYSHWEANNFCCESLIENPSQLVVYPDSSEASPEINPPTMAFQVTLIPGGAILGLSIHHWFMDASGNASFVRQLAQNCYALEHEKPLPKFDEALMDRSRFLGPVICEEDMVDVPAAPPKNTERLPCASLLLRLSKRQASELKQAAMPEDGTRISTYDAVVAFLWRIVTKHRASIYKPELQANAILGEAVNMRDRVEPPVSRDYQGVMACGALSLLQANPLTLQEVISKVPLSHLAAFIRTMTDGVDSTSLDKHVSKNAHARDKLKLHKTIDCLPPMSLALTDWRGADICGLDFGFGRSTAVRSPADEVIGNLLLLYPQRVPEENPDHGWDIALPFEEEHVDKLIADVDLAHYFQFCGYEAYANKSAASQPTV